MSKLTPAVLDADWAPVDDPAPGCWYNPKGVVYSSGGNCHSLAREALMERCTSARAYLDNNAERRKARSRKLTAFVQRLLVGAYLFLSWAVVLALLVG